MIPRSSIGIQHEDPEAVAGWPVQEDAYSEFLDGNRQYDRTILDATWDDAAEALSVEHSLVRSADQHADSGQQFDAAVDGDLEDWQAMALWGLDAGVAAAVLGLSAAGCIPTTSCRGHSGDAREGTDFPRLRFYADRERSRLVRDAALRTECGFGGDPGGPCAVWSRSIEEMLAFAEQLILQQEAFACLGTGRFGGTE